MIRIHPREFANKWDGVNSASGRTILEFLNSMNLPSNVILNTPDDGISLYDMPQITELVLNSTSTVGLEFAALGVPSVCVSPNSLIAYPQQLSSAAFSLEAYKALVVSPPIFDENELLLFSVRWMNFKQVICSMKIPKILSLMDRIYFGPLMRIEQRSRYIFLFLNLLFRFANLIFERLDRRRLVEFNTLRIYSVKSNSLVRRFSEALSVLIAKKYLSRIQK